MMGMGCIKFFIKKGILFVFLLLVGTSCNKTGSDRFNLNFRYSDSTDFVWKAPFTTLPLVDTLEIIDGKFPVYFQAQAYFLNYCVLKMQFFQTFIAPTEFQEEKEVEVKLRNKCINMDSLRLTISGISKQGEVIKTASMDINHRGEWREESLNVTFRGIEYFTISLWGGGLSVKENEDDILSRVYLDRMSITIDGKDINALESVNSVEEAKKESLLSSAVYPIVSYESNILKEIGLEKKKVIALGETVHGSKTINETVFEMAKNAILYTNCKLVLSEFQLASSLKFNLFVQGQIPQEEIFAIREEEHRQHFDMDSFIDFLQWLRAYNETVDRKVMVLGLLDTHEYVKAPLYDYVFAFYDTQYKDVLCPLLGFLDKALLEEAYDWLTNHAEKLASILGEKEYGLLEHVLSKLAAIETRKIHLHMDNYDYYMWLNTEHFISTYTEMNETVFVYAHYGHVKKKEGKWLDTMEPTLGVYLNECYRDKYGVIGLTVGVGSILTRKPSSQDFRITTLNHVEPGSFESICMKRPETCFYYPSDQLSQNSYLIREVGNKELPYHKNYSYSLLKANTDGFLFLRNSESIEDTYSYMEDYAWSKAMERGRFLTSIEPVN